MKYITAIFLVFLLLGCKTTETVEIRPETKLESKVAKIENELTKLEKQIENKNEQEETPLNQMEVLPPGLMVQSNKPVMCGEIGEFMTRMYKKYGETPILVGETSVRFPDGTIKMNIVTMLFNSETKSFTFIEQMPIDDRLVCMLASGKITRIKKGLVPSNISFK